MKKKKTPQRKLQFEKLEDRIYFSATPVVDVNIEDMDLNADALVNEEVDMTVSFENQGTEVGERPYVEVYFQEGLETEEAKALIEGKELVLHRVEYDEGGNPLLDVNPLTGRTLDKDLDKANGSVLYIEMPFDDMGSGSAGNIEFKGVVVKGGEVGIVGKNLDVEVRGGFLGDGEEIAGDVVKAEITPSVYRLSKVALDEDGKEGMGENYEVAYSIRVNIADGQQLDDLVITDELPDGFLVTGLEVAGDNGLEEVRLNDQVISLPYVGEAGPFAANDNQLIVDLGDETGSDSDEDIVITVKGYYGEKKSDGTELVDGERFENVARGEGVYRGSEIGVQLASAEMEVKAMPIVKTLEVLDSEGEAGKKVPEVGDILKYTVKFSVSDYYGFKDLVLKDLLSDGQELLMGDKSPTLTIKEQGIVTLDGERVDRANISSGIDDEGNTRLEIRLSDEMRDEGGDGTLLGDLYSDALRDGITEGKLVFFTRIMDEYRVKPVDRDRHIGLDDEIGSDVSVEGTIVGTNNVMSDRVSSLLTIDTLVPEKEVYSVNGKDPSRDYVRSGETVVYKISLTIPESDIENLEIMDYLPEGMHSSGDLKRVKIDDDRPDRDDVDAGEVLVVMSERLERKLGGDVKLKDYPEDNGFLLKFGEVKDASDRLRTIDVYFGVKAEKRMDIEDIEKGNKVLVRYDWENIGDDFDPEGPALKYLSSTMDSKIYKSGGDDDDKDDDDDDKDDDDDDKDDDDDDDDDDGHSGDISLLKSIVHTSDDCTEYNEHINREELNIGEIVKFRLVAEIPKGDLDNFTFKDLMPSGLQFVEGSERIAFVSDVNGGLTSSNFGSGPFKMGNESNLGSITPMSVMTDASVSSSSSYDNDNYGSGTDVFFKIGNVENTEKDRNKEFIVIEYDAIVLDNAHNDPDSKYSWKYLKDNKFMTFENKGYCYKNVDYSNKVGMKIVDKECASDPKLDIDKKIYGENKGDAGDVFTYEIKIKHEANSDGTAHDLMIKDLIPDDLEYVGNILVLDGDAPAVDLGNLPEVKFSWDELKEGDEIRFRFDVKMKDSVTVYTPDIINSAKLCYDNKEGDHPQEKKSCDEDDSGPIKVHLEYDVEKEVVYTSEDHTGVEEHDSDITDLTIGEEVIFEISYTFAEGTTPSVVLKDILNDVDGTLEILGGQIVHVGANLQTSATVGQPGILEDKYKGDGINDVVKWDLGTVVNEGENMTDPNDDDRIKVRIKALVKDLPENQDGDVITNKAILWKPKGDVVDYAKVEIVEPDLNIEKELVGDNKGDAGDVFTFKITVEHTDDSTADAFDLFILDELPPELMFVGNVTSVNGPAPQVIQNGNTLKFKFDEFDKDADPIVFKFDVKLRDSVSVHTEDIFNKAKLHYDTLKGDNAHERDYMDMDTGGPIKVHMKYDVEKEVFKTSDPKTGSEQHNPSLVDLAIGEEVTYKITFTFAEGTTPQVVLKDILNDADGTLEILEGKIVHIGANLDTTAVVNQAGVLQNNFKEDGINDTVLWNLGTVINQADNLGPNQDDQIVVHVKAKVLDLGINEDGDVITNKAILWKPKGDVIDKVDIEIVEVENDPDLKIEKDLLGKDHGDAGDVFTYKITVDHTDISDGDAFDLVIKDVIPDELMYLGNINVISGPAPVVDDSNLPEVTFKFDKLEQGADPIMFTFEVELKDSVSVHTEDIFNKAKLCYDDVEGYSHKQTVECDCDEAGPIKVKMHYDVEKEVYKTSNPHTGKEEHNPSLVDLTIGEEVWFDIEFTFAEGTTPNVVLKDLMNDPDGTLEILGGEIIHVGGNLTTTATVGQNGILQDNFKGDGINDTILWNLGNIVNEGENMSQPNDDDRIKVRVKAIVKDLGVNQDGDVITNKAILWKPKGDVVDYAKVEIVEPDLNIEKDLIGNDTGDAGDIFTFKITVDHTDQSTADAFDLTIFDELDPELMFAGNIVSQSGPAPTVVQNGNQLKFKFDELPKDGEPIMFTFDVKLRDSVSVYSDDIFNKAKLSYDTLKGDHPEERDYMDMDDAGPIKINMRYDVDKKVFETSDPSTDKGQHNPNIVDLAIGEEVTYKITFTFAEGTTPNVVLKDIMNDPDGTLEILSGEIIHVGNNLTTTGTVGQTAVLSDNFKGDGINDTAMWNLGNIVNAGDNLGPNQDDQIVVLVKAKVLDIPQNEDGDVITNKAILWKPKGDIVDKVDIEIVEKRDPDLEIKKDLIGPDSGDAGDVFTFKITLDHTDASTGNAYDIVIDDIIAEELMYLGNINVISGPAPNVVVNGDKVSFKFDELKLSDDPIMFTFEVKLNDTIHVCTEDIVNKAKVTYDNKEGYDKDQVVEMDMDEADPIKINMQYDVKKVVHSTSHDHTDKSEHNANRTDLTIGEEVTFKITYTFAEGTTKNVVLKDLMNDPDGTLEVLGGKIIHVGNNLTTSAVVGQMGTVQDNFKGDGIDDTVRFNLGDIVNAGDNIGPNQNDQIVILVKAIVKNIPENQDGDVITNKAVLWKPKGDVVDYAKVEIVEPDLNIEKDLIGDNKGVAGDTFTFQISIDHTGDSTADAFDLMVTDVLPPELVWAGNVQIINGPAPVVDDSNLPTITFKWDEMAQGAGTFTIQFDVKLADDVTVVEDEIFNKATLNYDSLPEDDAPEERDYMDMDKAGPIDVTLNFDFEKKVIDTSHDHTEKDEFNPNLHDLTIGETVTFELSATYQEGLTSNSFIYDQLPPVNGVLEIIGAEITHIGTNLTTSVNIGDMGVLQDSLGGDGVNDLAIFNIGQVINSGDNAAIDASQIKVQIIAKVLDKAENQAGDLIKNKGIFWNPKGDLVDFAKVEIVEPELNITKKLIGDNKGDAGDIFTFSIKIDHTNASTADAFDIVVKDVLPPELMFANNVISVSGPAPTTIVNGNEIKFKFDELPKDGEPILFKFDVKLTDKVSVFTKEVCNIAHMRYDTLPEDYDNDERVYHDKDKADRCIKINMEYDVEKTVIDTSEEHTESDEHNPNLVDLTIGEEVTYQIVYTFAEGTTPNVVLKDIINDPDGVLEILSGEVTFIGNNISTQNPLNVGDPATIQDNFQGDGINDTAVFNLGKVINSGDNIDDANDTIVIEVKALVKNLPQNQDGDVITNKAILWKPKGDVIDKVNVEIVEPVVDIKKELISENNKGDAGDIFTFKITLDHTDASTADAFDIVVKDVLPPELMYADNLQVISGAAPNVTINGNTIKFKFDELPKDGDPIMFTFDVKLTDEVSIYTEEICNVAHLRYDTLPADNAEEERVYRDKDEADRCIVINMEYDVDKTVKETSHDHTGSEEHNPNLVDLTIGEEVTYQIVYTFAEGMTPNVKLKDIINDPDGILEILSGEVTFIGNNISTQNPLNVGDFATLQDNFQGDGINDTAIFNLGKVTNSGDNIDNEHDTIVIEVKALVRNLPQNQDGDVITNKGILWKPKGDVVDKVKVNLVEPDLNIEKSLVSQEDTGDAGDIFTYEITVEHTGSSTADAFDLMIEDLIPSGLEFAGNLQAVNGPLPTVDDSGLPTVKFNWDELTLAQGSYTFRFDVVIADSVTDLTPDQINEAKITYDSLPEDDDPNERDYEDEDEAEPIKIDLLYDLTKTVVDTSHDHTGTDQFDNTLVDLTIGEEVTFELIVTFGEGTTNNVVIADSLPTNFGILNLTSAEISHIGANITNSNGLIVGDSGTFFDTNVDTFNDLVTFNFGDVVNAGEPGMNPSLNDQIKITVTALVVNQPENQDGDTIENQAKFLASSTDNLFDNAYVEIVEPELNIEKSIVGPDTGDAGDIFTFQITVEHTGDSHADAFDLVINDVLPSELEYVGNLQLINGILPNVDLGGLPGNVKFSWDELTLAQGSYTFQFDVKLKDTVTVNTEDQINTAILTYDTLPEDNDPNERDYEDEDKAGPIIVDLEYDLEKTIIDTSNPDTGSDQFNNNIVDLSIGETVTFQIVATFGEGTTENVLLIDKIPTNLGGILELTGAQISHIGANLTNSMGLVVGDMGILSDTNIDTFNDKAVFNFGTIVNAGDNMGPNMGDQIIIEVTAVVVNQPENAAGDLLKNRAKLKFNGEESPLVDTVKVEIVEPELTIDKSVDNVMPELGQTITYTLEIEHTQGSTATAHDIIVLDDLPDGFTLNVGSIVVNGANIVTNNSTGDTLDLLLDKLPLGDTITITYDVEVIDDADLGSMHTNVANIVWDSHPEDVPEEREGEDMDDETVTIHGPDLFVEKTTEAEEVQPGDTLVYTIVVGNKDGQFNKPANGLTLKDILPPDVTFVTSSNNGGINPPTQMNGMLIWNIPSLQPGETITFQVEVMVNETIEACNEKIHNTAQVSLDSQIDPTPEDNESETWTPVDAVPDYRITIDDGLTEIEAGSPVTYTIIVNNDGNQDGEDIVVVQTFPTDILINVVPDMGGVVDLNNGTITWTIPNFPAGNQVELTVTAFVPEGIPEGTIIHNEVMVGDNGCGGEDPTPLNNEDFDDTVVIDDEQEIAFSGFTDRTFGIDTDFSQFSPLVNIIPIYSGFGTPGSTITIEIWDQNENQVGFVTVMVDAGGNWMAHLPPLKDFGNNSYDRIEVNQIQSGLTAAGREDPTFTNNYAPSSDGAIFLNEDVTTKGVMDENAGNQIMALYMSTLNPVSANWDQTAFEYFGMPGMPKG